MRYALHDRETAGEIRFRMRKDLWSHVQAIDLCSAGTDADDVDHARRMLNPRFEIHDFDTDGVVRTEGCAPPPDIG